MLAPTLSAASFNGTFPVTIGTKAFLLDLAEADGEGCTTAYPKALFPTHAGITPRSAMSFRREMRSMFGRVVLEPESGHRMVEEI